MGTVWLIVLVVIFVLLALISARRVVFFSVAVMIIIMSISNAEFMPRAVFGIIGLNVANIVWLFSFMLVSMSMLSKKGSLRLQSYMSLPLSVFILLYLLASVWSIIDIHSIDRLHYITRISIFIENIIKPMQFLLAGWIVMAACELEGNSKSIQRAIYMVPLILAPLQLYYFLIGGGSGDEYREGRQIISESIGYHANELGAVGAYMLAIILLIKEDKWKIIRYIAIGASLLIVAVSFSRMAYVTTIILLSVVFIKLNAKEKTAVVSMAAVIVVVFSAQLANRIYTGTDDQSIESVDINAVLAGRIDGIWKPLVPHMTDNIVLGSGVYGLLKAGPVSRGLPTHPHNAYLQVVLDLGLVGLFALVWMLLRFRSQDKRADGTFKYLVMCWMLMGLTGHSFYPIYANFLVWVGYGLMLAARHEKLVLPEVENEDSSERANSTRILRVKSNS